MSQTWPSSTACVTSSRRPTRCPATWSTGSGSRSRWRTSTLTCSGASRNRELVGAARGHEESRTITFDSESLTIMVSITPTGYDVVRLDGWLAPPGGHEVELRTARGPLTTIADEQGRFALDDVPHGLA